MISVIIPTYCEEKFLPACLGALKKCKTSGYEIIVVDAGSNDKTVKVARSAGCRVVNGKLDGVGAARNAGVKAAHGTVVAFLDADSIPCLGWLDLIEKTFAKHRDIDAIGGPTTHGSLRYAIADLPFWLNPITKHFGFFYFSGNNAAYRKDFFLSVGGFKPIYCEEAEFSIRISKQRRRMLFVSNLLVRLSPRRFEKLGFLMTEAKWLFADLKLFLGIYDSSANYGAEIKK